MRSSAFQTTPTLRTKRDRRLVRMAGTQMPLHRRTQRVFRLRVRDARLPGQTRLAMHTEARTYGAVHATSGGERVRPPLWMHVEGTGSEVTVSLARCRNCGKVKATSDPCSFDHLAAVMEFGEWLRERGYEEDA